MERVEKIFQVEVGTLSKNFDVRAAIGDVAENFIGVGKIFHERTKSYALHNPENFYVEQSFHLRADCSRKLPPVRVAQKMIYLPLKKFLGELI